MPGTRGKRLGRDPSHKIRVLALAVIAGRLGDTPGRVRRKAVVLAGMGGRGLSHPQDQTPHH